MSAPVGAEPSVEVADGSRQEAPAQLASDTKPLSSPVPVVTSQDLKERTAPVGLKRRSAARVAAAEHELRLPLRGITAPEFRQTSKLSRGLSGHYEDLPTLYDLKTRRLHSGIFVLNNREDLREIGHHLSTVSEKPGPQQDQAEIPDPNIIVFDGPDDPLNAQNWPLRTKILQTVLLALSTLVVTFASSVFSSATEQLETVFSIGEVVATLSTSLFVLGYVVGPLIWGPASELLGRREPIVGSYLIFAIFQIPVAVAQNYYTVAICRFFGGVAAAGPLTVVSGAFSDFWSAEARGGALAIFACAVFAGPAIGPIVGSFIVQSYLGWRYCAWITCFWAFLMFFIQFFFLKESFAPRLLSQKAKKLRFKTKNWAIRSKLDEREFDIHAILFTYFFRPIRMLMVEPILLLLSIYISFIYGILYLLFSAVPLQFQFIRGWKPGDASLVFICVFLGAAIGSLIIWLFTPRYVRKLHAARAISVPEERCIPMAIGGLLFPVGIFIFGWTDVEHVSSFWPSLVGLLLLSVGILLIFLSAINYIVDAFLFLAASAIAANTFMRSMFGAGFPLFAIQMFDKLGYSAACSLIGGLACGMMPIPIAFYIWGPRLRAMSKYAPKIPPAGAQPTGAMPAADKPAQEQPADHANETEDSKDIEKGSSP